MLGYVNYSKVLTILILSDILIFRNMQLQTTAIVRDRFQLTIPDLIRVGVNWVTPGSVVTVAQVKADEIVIKPHIANKRIDWDKLWKNIRLARSHQGAYQGSLSDFIVSDRESH